MDKILSPNEAIKCSQHLRQQRKTIVLAGGCFDILHIGHVLFLEAAKKRGDHLMVLLEHDTAIQKMKGQNRPINVQEDRARVLAALRMVDSVVMLPYMQNDKSYDDLIFKLEPHIIAITNGDPDRHHKIRQAQQIYATVVDVVRRVAKKSTSSLARMLAEEYYL